MTRVDSGQPPTRIHHGYARHAAAHPSHATLAASNTQTECALLSLAVLPAESLPQAEWGAG